MRNRLCAAAMAWGWALLAALAAAREPATRPGGAALRECVDRNMTGLLSGPAERHDAARAALLALEKAYLGALLAHADDPDAEVRVRVREVLARVGVETRVARTLAKLPARQRGKLARLRSAQPVLFGKIFSDDWPARVAAMEQLAKLDDPNALAGPLVALCLRHPGEELRLAAARAAATGRYRSDAVVDALTVVAQQRDDHASWFRHGDEEPRSPAWHALAALGKLRSKRAAPGLLAALKHAPVYDMRRQAILAETLAATGERRLIPPLMEHLKQSRSSYQTHITGVGKLHLAKSDAALLALLKLTGQSADAYGLIYREGEHGRLALGFKDKAARRDAIRKFRGWWDANKDKPGYKGLAPLKLPARPVVTPPRPPAIAQPAPSTTAPARAQATGKLLADRAGRLVAKLRSRRYAARREAQAELVALHKQLVEAVARHAPAGEQDEARRARGRIGGVLGEMIVEVRIASMLAAQPTERRQELVRLRAQAGPTFDELFSLNWSKQAPAMRRIARAAPAAGALEVLVLRAMRHPSDDAAAAALEALRRRKLKSDAVVEAVGRFVAEKLVERQAPYPPPRSRIKAFGEAVKAFRDLAGPRMAPLALALLKAGTSESESCQVLADVIARSGEKRAIGVLLELLKDTRWQSTWSSGGFQLTMKPADAPLMALVQLSGQDPKDYPFIYWKSLSFDRRPYGFKDEESRKAALAKFRAWWAKHKTDAAYKDLEPLVLPELPGRGEDKP